MNSWQLCDTDTLNYRPHRTLELLDQSIALFIYTNILKHDLKKKFVSCITQNPNTKSKHQT